MSCNSKHKFRLRITSYKNEGNLYNRVLWKHRVKSLAIMIIVVRLTVVHI